MLRTSTTTLAAAALAVPILALAFVPAFAQGHASDPTTVAPVPAPANPGTSTAAPAVYDGKAAKKPGQWQDKFRNEVREHPRLGRALVSLHEARDYLLAAKGDFGGNKASTIAACDEAIAKIREAIKFDPKKEPPAAAEAKPGETPPTSEPPRSE